MTFISLPNVGTLSLDAASFLTGNPLLVNHLVGNALSDALTHALNSYVRRSRKRRGISRRVMRKTANRKRRWFVDNIIMHHKRLHDRNRAIIISNARSRALSKRKTQESLNHSQSFQQREFERHGNQNSAANLKDKAKSLRGRVDARRLRARSRWFSVAEEFKTS